MNVNVNDPVWDKAHSTFMRVIYLKNGYSLTGYSKKVGRNERRDKIDLLTNWILRDLKSGYLDPQTTNPKITPLTRIEFFLKNGDNYEPVVHLYYTYPDWINPRWLNDKKLVSFLNRFYDLLSKQVIVPSIVNALEVRTRAPKFDPLDISAPRFSNMRDLNACVQRLLEEGSLQEEAINHFYRQYKLKYFNQ